MRVSKIKAGIKNISPQPILGALPIGKERTAESLLVKAAQAGDRKAFESLVMGCQARLLRWLTQLTRNRAVAEELLQESLFKAFVSLASFRAEASFATWLSHIARNTFLSWQKEQGRRPDCERLLEDEALTDQVAQSTDWLNHIETPEETLWQQELSGVLQQALAALPADLREAFELREQAGLSYEEIAQHQKVPVGTIRSRIHRARTHIARHLKPLMEPA